MYTVYVCAHLHTHTYTNMPAYENKWTAQVTADLMTQ